MAATRTSKSTKSTNAKHVPIAAAEAKDMSPEAVRQRRSDAQKAAVRMQRTTTAADRAASLKVAAAKGNDKTVNDTLRAIYSSRGEIITKVASGMVEVKRSDVIRQLKQLEPTAKSPFKLVASETDELVHILA